VKNIYLLMEIFCDAEGIYNAKDTDFRKIGKIPAKVQEKLLALKKSLDINEVMDYMDRKNIDFISIYDAEYPELLKTIDNPPFGLFVIGHMPKDECIKISVVGTRRCSQYGRSAAYTLSRDLALKNAVIVSGLAEGIDAMAHKGALDAKGITLGVMACGVDICYPHENKNIYSSILERGAIVSEFPPRTEPKPWFFPMRNRIISGLSHGCLIVEAPLKSGSLITANYALDQGREVMAVPGNITSRLSAGSNMLIKEGAHLAASATDIFDCLGIIEDEKENTFIKSGNNELAPDEKLVYDCISLTPVTVDEIMHITNMRLPNIQYILIKLELMGIILKQPGQRFIRS